MPNKQLACEYVDELTPAAKLVGAINTIVNDGGQATCAAITPTARAVFAPYQSGFDIKGKTMVLLRGGGGGGTARGAIEGLKEIKLFNRPDDFDKALAFAQRAAKTPIVVTVTPISPMADCSKPWLPPTF